MSNYNISLQSNNTDLQAILNTINELPEAGTDLPELTNEGTSANLLSGKQLINSDGEVVTGSMSNNGSISSTMDGISTKSITVPAGYTSGGTISLDNTIDDEADTQSGLIAQIKSAVENLPEAGSSGSSGIFPHKITFVDSAGFSNPVICYGDDGDTVIIITNFNSAGGYSCKWSYTNCTLMDFGNGIGFGNYAVFSNFSSDATITVTWTIASVPQ